MFKRMEAGPLIAIAMDGVCLTDTEAKNTRRVRPEHMPR